MSEITRYAEALVPTEYGPVLTVVYRVGGILGVMAALLAVTSDCSSSKSGGRVGSPKPIPWRSGPLGSPGPAPVTSRSVRDNLRT